MVRRVFTRQMDRALERHSIGRRFLLWILLFSSLVTLAATGVQLYTDYQRDLGQIKNRLGEIESSYLASIGASLWNLDVKQLQLQLDGIEHLPDVQAVSVRETSATVIEPLHIVKGEFQDKQTLNREYVITHRVGGEQRPIGVLQVQASLEDVYERLWDKVVVILLSQGVKTFLVSLFILYLFYRLVAVHLTDIARHVSQYDFARPARALHLQRRSPPAADELDQVVSAFNVLTQNLSSAYEHMRDVNEKLAEDIVAREAAEAEVKRLNAVLEQRVEQRTAELEGANRELASFCYSVSHDLRAPLRRIEGFRRMLNDELAHAPPGQTQHYLSRIEAGTREMTEMIDSFLRLSRATQSELRVERMNLSHLSAQLMDSIMAREPDRPVDLEIEPDMYIEVDRRFFAMMMTNLLENAWKYSGNCERVQIDVGRRRDESGRWVYYVADRGAGFDMKYASRLFTPFSRLHKTEEFDGVGIGLATVQRIITRHGGRVWADARPDEGATFYFTLWEKGNRDSEYTDNSAG